MSHRPWLGLVAFSLLIACRGPTEPTPSSATIRAAEVQPPSGASQGLGQCPNTVPGAATVVTETPDGVELRITASAEAAAEIRKRAAFLASEAERTRGMHKANGEGGGRFGRCPVVMRNTKVETREIPSGVAVVLRPRDAQELGWLRREVESRSAQVWAPKPFGPGLMKACPNAVPGSETIIEDAPYGVDMRVTSTSEGGARAIRERAHELARRSSSGEALDARCPAALPLATLVVSELPGGVKIAVSAKRTEDARALRRAARERERDFAPPVLR